MLTLAIDCALRRIHLGAADGEVFLGELSADVGTRQSEALPGAVGDFLRVFGFTVSDVGRIAVTTGPGYFTGIRVGLSYAAALAESVGALVCGVSTLRAMALPVMEAPVASEASPVTAPVITAGRDSFYAAIYGARRGIGVLSGQRDVLMEPSHISARDLSDRLGAFEDSGVVVVSCGAPAAAFKQSFHVLPPSGVPRGVLMAAASEPYRDPSEIRAVYLRLPC